MGIGCECAGHCEDSEKRYCSCEGRVRECAVVFGPWLRGERAPGMSVSGSDATTSTAHSDSLVRRT